MMNWILNNLSTIIVAAILLIIVIMIIKHQIQTRHTCSSGCGGCPRLESAKLIKSNLQVTFFLYKTYSF